MSEYNEMEFRAKLLANQKDKLIAGFEIERKLKETKTKDQNLIKRTHIIEVDD